MKTKEGFDFSKAKRGSVISHAGETRITIHLPDDVLMAFRLRSESAGIGYQTMIHEALRVYLENTGKPFEDTLRRVIREELCAVPDRTTEAISDAPGRPVRNTVPAMRKGEKRIPPAT